MKRLELVFSNEILLEDQRKMKLIYNLTEKNSVVEEGKPLYGIQITKHLEETVETEEVNALSYSKEAVIRAIKKLFQHEVTPISMVEILDDFVTQGI